MSERDPRYNPVELLTNATYSDTETAAEWSALREFRQLAEELNAEKQKRDSLVKHSVSTAKLPLAIQDHLRSQQNCCINRINQLSDQVQQMSRAEVLEPVVWRAYRKVCEEDAAIVHTQQEEAFQSKLDKITSEYAQRHQQSAQNSPKASESYEESYESYKKALLRSQYFIEQFNQHYKNTLHGEKDFINKNGVLSKVGILSAICGLCFGFFFSFGETDNVGSIIVRCVLAVGGVASFFFAMSIACDYKKASGKSNFYSFVYNRYIADHIQKDKQKETDSLLRDMLKKMNSTVFTERYEQLSRYDRFEKDILEDYHFSKAIDEHVK